jgi:hypothetical protein
MAIAQAIIDDEHGTPHEKDDGDHNSYFLGSISNMNIVIACLPAGSLGGVSAAMVTAQMLRTVKRVRVSLLVGIGSGTLSTEDNIRLGNMVVSMPSDDHGSVIWYMFTRSSSGAFPAAGTEGGNYSSSSSTASSVEFVRTCCLNKPPVVLLTALLSLQAKHGLLDSNISMQLAQAAKWFSKLWTKLIPPRRNRAARATANQLL